LIRCSSRKAPLTCRSRQEDMLTVLHATTSNNQPDGVQSGKGPKSGLSPSERRHAGLYVDHVMSTAPLQLPPNHPVNSDRYHGKTKRKKFGRSLRSAARKGMQPANPPDSRHGRCLLAGSSRGNATGQSKSCAKPSVPRLRAIVPRADLTTPTRHLVQLDGLLKSATATHPISNAPLLGLTTRLF
jgi:hypothetical protein